jgi:PAS domain S-box-containing protein
MNGTLQGAGPARRAVGPAFLAGGGEMGARIRAHDWRATPLGAPETWPVSLRTVVAMMLRNPEPVFVAWGPEQVSLYNDACIPFIVEPLHPAALGGPFTEAWRHHASDLQDIIRKLVAGESDQVVRPVPVDSDADGPLRWFALTWIPLLDDHGAPAGFQVSAHERSAPISTDSAKNAPIDGTASLFRSIIDNMDQATWLADPSGSVYWYSKRFFEVTGADPEMVRGWGWRHLHHPDHIERVLERLPKHVESGEPWEDIFPMRCRDGDYRWFLSRAVAIRDQHGSVVTWFGSNTDITERYEAEEREKLLAREVDHRAKNMLAVVQSIVLLTSERDPDALRSAVVNRIQALARAHTLLASSRWEGVDFRRLVEEELAPFMAGVLPQAFMQGPSLVLRPDAAQALAMILHELATNAVKYGALGAPSGRVRVQWSVQRDGRLRLLWRESGGRPVSPPKTHGFGSTVISTIVQRQLRGDLSMDWAAKGLFCSLTIPVETVGRRMEQQAARAEPVPARSLPGPRKVLLVEDEVLVGMQMRWALENAGFEVQGPVAFVDEALASLSRSTPDVALLDVNLAGERSFPVAEALLQRSIPFAFCTGYSGTADLPSHLREVRILDKPCTPAAIAGMVRELSAHGQAADSRI